MTQDAGVREEVDVVVVGLGPGGEHAAIKLGRAGLDVVAVEERLVGGECPYYGCVPSKMMIAAAHTLRETRRVEGRAGSAQVTPDWAPVAKRIREEATDDWDDAAAVARLEDNGARFVRGHGRFTGPREITVDGTTYAARRGVVLDPGTSPAAPPVPGLADVPYWTNRDAVQLTSLPGSLAVLGGGAIGCELAQAMAEFGVRVTVLEAADRLLPPEEPEASAVVAEAFASLGVDVRTGARVEQVRHEQDRDDAFVLTVGGEELRTEALLVAAGRRPNLDDLGLEHLGLDPDAKVLETDERMRVADGVWAVGDVVGKGAFTHVSMYQAAIAIRDILGEPGPPAEYRGVSRVTFTMPEVATVGLTEGQAREAGIDVVTGTGDLGSRGWLADENGVVKVVADRARKVVVGATVAGPAAGEVIGLLATAVHAEVPLDTLRSMHYAYPTYHRAIETVLDDLDA